MKLFCVVGGGGRGRRRASTPQSFQSQPSNKNLLRRPCSCPHPTPSPSDLKGTWRAPRVLRCKVCKLQEGEGANVPSSWNTWIPSSREVLGVWPEDREERATWPLARTPAAAIILWRRVQISSAISPALLLGLSLEPLWFCPVPTRIPRKAGG